MELVGPPPVPHGTAVCVMRRTAPPARAERARVCATAEGQVLQVAPRTAFLAVESSGTDSDEDLVRGRDPPGT